MKKESQEANAAAYGLIDSFAASLKDGKFDVADILQNFIDDVGRVQEGIKGFKPGEDLADATNEEMDGIHAAGFEQLKNLKPEADYDVKQIGRGLWSTARLFLRQGEKQGRAKLLKEMVASGFITQENADQLHH